MKTRRRRERELQPNSKSRQEKIVDLTNIKPQRKRNTVRSGLGDSSSVSSSSKDIVLMTIPESNSKGLEEREDEYAKYDQMFDGAADQILINSGATIIRSEITLTDSLGHNRTIVRRNDNDW